MVDGGFDNTSSVRFTNRASSSNRLRSTQIQNLLSLGVPSDPKGSGGTKKGRSVSNSAPVPTSVLRGPSSTRVVRMGPWDGPGGGGRGHEHPPGVVPTTSPTGRTGSPLLSSFPSSPHPDWGCPPVDPSIRSDCLGPTRPSLIPRML